MYIYIKKEKVKERQRRIVGIKRIKEGKNRNGRRKLDAWRPTPRKATPYDSQGGMMNEPR